MLFDLQFQLLRFLKSPKTSRQELFCPRNIEGDNFIVKTSETINGCGDEYNLCNGDSECGPGLKCCPSGCIYKCVVPQPLRRAIGKFSMMPFKLNASFSKC